MNDTAKIQEKKAALEEELRRTEKQIYDLEGEYLEARPLQRMPCPQTHATPVVAASIPRGDCSATTLCHHFHGTCDATLVHCLWTQETLKDGNILRGWDGYLGNQASSGAIRRINRFREADRMFSASSMTSGQASTFTSAKVRHAACYTRLPAT